MVAIYIARFNVDKLCMVVTFCLCVSYVSHIKQQPLPYTSLTGFS